MTTLIELKAAAYDAIAQVQIWQKQLDSLNEQIKGFVAAPAAVPEPEKITRNGKDRANK